MFMSLVWRDAEEISGIFVKSIAKGSAADSCRKICINDQIIEVDGRSLYGYTNHQAVEVLRSAGKVVKLRLARYLRGAKYEQLQEAIASTDIPVHHHQSHKHHRQQQSQPPPPVPPDQQPTRVEQRGSTLIHVEQPPQPDLSLMTKKSSDGSIELSPFTPAEEVGQELLTQEIMNVPQALSSVPSIPRVSSMNRRGTEDMAVNVKREQRRSALETCWSQFLGPDYIIVVSNLILILLRTISSLERNA